jgi:hypothetical protein
MERGEPDYLDLDADRYGWCKTCAKETVIVKRDFGTGERTGSRGFHVDILDCCADCGNTY